ncbi:DNA translocase FtsK [bacterium]|nr:DNA translocase FtsK [candidate division CSSED10-310 bacterium]
MSSLVKNRIFRESVGIILIALAVFLVIGFSTFHYDGEVFTSRCGRVGTFFVRNFLAYIGVVSIILPLSLVIIGIIFFRYRQLERKWIRLSGFLLFLISACAFCSHIFPDKLNWNDFVFSAGGKLGVALVNPIRLYLDVTGTSVLLISFILITILGFTGWSYNRFLAWAYRTVRLGAHRLHSWLRTTTDSILIRRKNRKALKEEQKLLKKQESIKRVIAEQPQFDRVTISSEEVDDDESFATSSPLVINHKPPVINPKIPPPDYLHDEDAEIVDAQDSITAHSRHTVSDDSRVPLTRSIEYQYPDISLFDDPPAVVEKESHAELLQKSEMLISKLREFSVEGRITEVCPGPVITRYEFEPAPGIKISKIIGLSDDLALGMRSKFGLRVSPLPGKSTLGVEIPNHNRETVYLKDVLLSDEFQKARKKSILSLPLGKDTAGRPYISDLKRMPHLLIAGATGSGKSVCINTILAGLLYVAKPTEIRFLLIDPKMLELSDFNNIPHLREPVITDCKQTPDALNWAVVEMERRYRLLAGNGVRNIDQFNSKVSDPDYTGELEPLPYLVIVIDELADLMLTAAATIEDTIQRLAQMARAAGIHLIIATQRPSVDVITGVIKANLPCRLAFQVASKVDSRTILDTIGAEKLIGMGDCIFIPPGTSQLVRVHGAYVSEAEIKRLVHHLSQQPAPDDSEESIFETSGLLSDDMEAVDDPMYDEAVRLVLTSGVASISMLQRRLKVGHSRASRLIDFMELSGIVGPHIGSKTRDILVDPDEFLNRMNEIKETDVYE